MSKVALVTGAAQGLGLALVAGLARRLDPDDTVYLTSRRLGEVALGPVRAEVRTELLDVADPDAARRTAALIADRHGGIDILFSNAHMRTGPTDDDRAIIRDYVEVNNLGPTRLLREFAPLLRDGGRLIVVASSFGSLDHLAPSLHHHFDDLTTLDQVDAAVIAWRDAVADGSARASAWPTFANIPSKIAGVAAVRALAHQRRDTDLDRGVLVAAVCPGMINTPASAAWWDVSTAPSPAEAAVALLDLALDPVNPDHYGQLVRAGEVIAWRTTVG
ncbi:SDR family NAD(P)-dependent oxidoreductase [Actinokineospora inagensis]|uniref:SDR family NAD(P)-dependent oxidoreductase n=1 Tax=Actinokineospora inagensis TaxID=103730 RepID=UPI000400F8A7|nr:SDR family NAD(P)-dependent oxidoreductase [Actinokineospora inagensis]